MDWHWYFVIGLVILVGLFVFMKSGNNKPNQKLINRRKVHDGIKN